MSTACHLPPTSSDPGVEQPLRTSRSVGRRSPIAPLDSTTWGAEQQQHMQRLMVAGWRYR